MASLRAIFADFENRVVAFEITSSKWARQLVVNLAKWALQNILKSGVLYIVFVYIHYLFFDILLLLAKNYDKKKTCT